MNALELVSGPYADDFFPFTLTRSVADIRCGILTIRQKWAFLLKSALPLPAAVSIPDNILPDAELIKKLYLPQSEKSFQQANCLLSQIDILRYNGTEIKNDFLSITAGRHSEPVSSTNKLTGTDIFLEPGVKMEHSFLNASDGPIYIGRDSLIMEGSMIRGPFAIGEKGVVKMGAKIYGSTSAGPHCVLGGEIKNSVILGYSNKAHDGYLGDSIIGEWCNLGAGSSNSNMKNSGGTVRLWNPLKKSFTHAGQKCGLMMGDYSRSAINTSFNTGTVTGVSCHVFGNGPTPAYLPSFSWGFVSSVYAFEKAVEHIRRWKKLKGAELSAEEIIQLKNIFAQQNQMK